MSDTHINAFYGARDEALKEVQAAQAKYEAANIALETKLAEGDAPAPQAEPTTEEPREEKKAFGRR